MEVKLARDLKAFRLTVAVCILASIAPAANADPFRFDNTVYGSYGNPSVDVSNVIPATNPQNGTNTCAPTATANGMAYLTNAFPLIFKTNLLQNKPSEGGAANPQSNNNSGWTAIANQLASNNYMKTDGGLGTSQENWITGAEAYINNNAPGKTDYSAINDPGADFLLAALKSKADLEIGITMGTLGHVLTVTGASGTTDAKGAVTSMTIDGIDPDDPTHPFHYVLGNVGGKGQLTLTYKGDSYAVDTGFAIIPKVPEPRTYQLLLIGGGLLFLQRRVSWR